MILKKTRLMVDGHVHIYNCYNLGDFFRNAVKNLGNYYHTLYANGTPYENILLLTEAKENDFFSKLKETGGFSNKNDYSFHKTKEDVSIALYKDKQRLCYVIKGRQIVTRENLEVLAIGIDRIIPDGLEIDSVLENLVEKQELAVLAWGFGKWFFKRGKNISRLIEKYRSPYLLIGDNSGRPVFWPYPGLFKKAADLNSVIINGSDSLPFKGEEYKAGTYGFSLEGEFDEDKPAASLRDMLITPDPAIDLFGKRDSMRSFLTRQTKIYLKKYLKK